VAACWGYGAVLADEAIEAVCFEDPLTLIAA